MVSFDNPISGTGGAIVGKIFTSILWFGIAIIIVSVLGGILYYYLVYKKKFDIRVKIKSERAGDPRIYFDMAAILYDKKDKNKYFRLRDTRVDLPVPPFAVLQTTNWGDYVEIWRKSEDEFIFLTAGTIDKQNIIRQDGKLHAVADIEQKQIEGDISFWNIKRKEKNKGLFDTESLLMKILPYLPLIIGGMFMIFMLYILMDNLPTLIQTMTELAEQLRSLKGADVTTYGSIIPILWTSKNLMN